MSPTKSNIQNFAQNKPTLVVKDIIEKYPNIDTDFIYEVLLKRGVFKWLAVRRKLIKLKDVWKTEVRKLNEKNYRTDKEKGELRTLIKCRAEIRKLCHSDSCLLCFSLNHCNRG